jgi:hypothetical protein
MTATPTSTPPFAVHDTNPGGTLMSQHETQEDAEREAGRRSRTGRRSFIVRGPRPDYAIVAEYRDGVRIEPSGPGE